ncbi:MAG: nucleotidyltransferase domain-containing protein [Bacteriovorax sp.]|nr:nucleotidyltransferase domain-containing protein [Bacteriovorax sp.]
MKSFGLRPEELQEIKQILQKTFGDLEDAKVYLFGSRATGKHKEYSDIDLAINSKSKELSKKISLFNEEWEKSKLPYKVDLTSWKDIYKSYLPKIRKEKFTLWRPEDKALHPWRVCPYGESWVKRHPRKPKIGHVQDVDGHCRKNSSKKDILFGDEINSISKTLPFISVKPLPCPYVGNESLSNPNEYDVIIAGWCNYWNDIFKPDVLIEPGFVKALIESESRFNPKAFANNKQKKIGMARGLIQLTEQTFRILKNRKGEIKDHYIDLKKDELFEPEKNICASIRWLFHKREILRKRLGRSPSWTESVVEYKGLGKQLKNNGKDAVRIMKDFNLFLQGYKC